MTRAKLPTLETMNANELRQLIRRRLFSVTTRDLVEACAEAAYEAWDRAETVATPLRTRTAQAANALGAAAKAGATIGTRAYDAAWTAYKDANAEAAGAERAVDRLWKRYETLRAQLDTISTR
jgi:hypothetical protein